MHFRWYNWQAKSVPFTEWSTHKSIYIQILTTALEFSFAQINHNLGYFSSFGFSDSYSLRPLAHSIGKYGRLRASF
jgi:hypothetical protein